MSISEQEWQEEQQRVERVVHKINNRIDVLQTQVGETRADIVELRRLFWEDDVRMNMEDVGEAGETSIALKQQAELLSERERTMRLAHNEYKKLLKLQQSTYFGRIDFLEHGERNTERIYIGVGSFLDEETDEFLVYDWRAPVSSLYYDYGTGPAEFETPGGTIAGEIELKRQFVIRDGRIRNLFDTGVTIGDELLQAVLSRHSDSQMKSIVATIQQEQNRIIRNERSRLLIVQGAAGSGKTSAALQRVAYLLYAHRETLSARQIVLFSPNPMFNSYIATVLPELGEENMQQTTLQDYLEHRMGETFELEDPFAQIEYTLTAMQEPGYEARLEGIRFKANVAFMGLIERYAEWLGQEGMIFRDLKAHGEVYLTKEHIRGRFFELEKSLPIPNRMKLLVKVLLQDLDELAIGEREKKWVDEEIELLNDEAFLRVHNQLKKQKVYEEDNFDYHDRERELLADMVIRRRYKPLRARVRKLRFLGMARMYRQLFADPAFAERFAGEGGLPELWPAICAQTVERWERQELAYEDATPYLDLKERIEGFETNTQIRHVFLDEAQDYSPIQLAFIKRLFPFARMTVLGDLNQAIYAHAQTDEESNGFVASASLYPPEETETIILTRSYRSTRPIIELTRQLIPGGEAIEPFNREGDLPTVTRVADVAHLHEQIAARIRSLQAAEHQTIAVICKTAEESQTAFEALKRYEEFELRLVGKETVSFATGVLVIPSYLAKGVEFDAVILYNASEDVYGRESERKLFYTACTRAMHELHLYFVGRMSPLLAAVTPASYKMEE